MKLVIALSGAVASGKSTVANAILASHAGERISTRAMIIARTGVASERESLQAAGDRLDQETGGKWVADDSVRQAATLGPDAILIVDAVRLVDQVEHLRAAFGEKLRHVHLIAEPTERERRHLRRDHDVIEPDSYDAVRVNLTEAYIDKMAEVADISFDASRLDEGAMAAVALAGLGLSSRMVVPLVDVIVGGQYGSEGKGNICAYLARDYDVLVRVGGPNAGHRVKDPDYDFIHLPSGALHNPDARLLIGAGATLSLPVILREIAELNVSPARLSIDPQAIIIEQEDVDWETEALEVIGSTKKGVGVATARKILGRGKKPFGAAVRLACNIDELQPFVRSVGVELEKAYAAGHRVMLEGTQGTDLSLHHGMWPHVTSRETTASGCLSDAGIAPNRVRKVIMVARTYPIRVGGTSGYMGVEIDMQTVADRSGLDVANIQQTEVGTVSGKPRRIAEFDLGQVRRAAALNGATEIAITFADYLSVENVAVPTFEKLTAETQMFVTQVEEVTGCPVTLISTNPHKGGMIDRRME